MIDMDDYILLSRFRHPSVRATGKFIISKYIQQKAQYPDEGRLQRQIDCGIV